jgi:RHS repeat-associated protein
MKVSQSSEFGLSWFRGGLLTPRLRAVALGACFALAGTVGVAAVPQRAVAALAAAKVAQPVKSSAPDLVSAQLTARAQGSRVEVEALRDATSTTWVNPDGTMTTQAHAGAVRFKDSKGAWRDVDLTLAARADGTVGVKSHPLGVSVAGAGKGAGGGAKAASGTDLVVVDEVPGSDKAARQVVLGWPGSLPAPVLEGTRATYRDAAPGLDVVVESRRSGFEQLTVIRDRAALGRLVEQAGGAEVSWSLPVKTKGLTARAEKDGSVSFVDAKGATVSRFAAPVAWDDQVDPASGDKVNVSPVKVTVAQHGKGRAVLTMTPDQAWLTDPARVFPVTVDPTYATGSNVTTSFDTYVQSGKTWDTSAETELRVGTSDGGASIKARSYLNFSTSAIRGKQIMSASLSLYEFHSYGCTAKTIYAYDSATASTSTRWTSLPAVGTASGSASFAKGYSSSCPDARVSIPVTNILKAWSAGSATSRAIRLTASETDSNAWKKFNSVETSADPYVTYTYNRKPNAGTAPKITGGVTYTPPGGTAATYSSDSTPELSTVATDPDGNTYRTTIEVHTSTTTSSTTLKASCVSGYVSSGTTAKCTASSGSALSNNSTYYARAAISDDQGLSNGTWSPWTTIRIGSTAPSAPSMSCPSPYVDSSWSGTIPASINCSLTVNGTSWSAPSMVLVYDNGALVSSVAITPPSGTPTSGTFAYTPSKGGHHLTLTSRNPAGVTSATQGTYDLGFGDATMQVPADKTVTNGIVNVGATLKAPATSGTLQSHLQYRLPKDLGQANGWVNDSTPLATSNTAGTVTATGTWNLGAVTSAQLSGVSAVQTTVLQARVCVHTTADATCLAWTTPNTITRPIFRGGGISDGAGGAGSVDLSSGIFITGATDVSVPGLSIGRDYDTLDPAATGTDSSKGIFGPGWTSTLDGGPDGLTGWTVEDHVATQGHFLLTSPDQSTTYAFGYPGGASGLYFATATGTDTAFTANSDDAVEAAGLLKVHRLTGTATAATLTYTDSEGTETTWTGTVNANGTAASPSSWIPQQVIDPDSSTGSLHAYPAPGQPGKVGTLIYSPGGVSCGTGAWSTTQRGCTRLDVAYAASTNASGDFAGQVQTISAQVWNHDAGVFTPVTTVASYQYDALGQLVSVTDSRTQLTTRYAYTNTLGRLSTIVAAGRAPYRIWYDSAGKVSAVSRDDASLTSWLPSTTATPPPGSTYLARYAYNVSPSGNGSALPNLSTTSVAPWFQGADATGNPTGPSYGFAVFGPNYPTESALPTAATDVGWRYAHLTYTAGDYTPVNTAQYGAGRWLLTATDYNADGTVARTLNETAIAEVQDNAISGSPLERGQVDDLSTQTTYIPETVAAADVTVGTRTVNAGDVTIPAGTQISDIIGPLHDAVISGATEQGVRTHTQFAYDASAPNGGLSPDTGQSYGLVTEQKIYARSAGNTDPAQNTDVALLSWTVNGYSALGGDTVTGWKLGVATTITTKDPSGTGPDITRATRYDSAGRVLENRQPSATSSGAAGTLVTTYYTAAGTGTCSGTPEWAEQICTTGPGGGPLPTTRYTYGTWGGVVDIIESNGGTTLRTTHAAYDAAGRRQSTSIVTAGSVVASTPQPDIAYGYSTTTGEQTTATKAGANSAITVSSDGWGRPTTYVNDANEATTTTYNSSGYPQSVSSLAGTFIYTFDSLDPGREEHRGLPTKLTVSRENANRLLTYTASYNPAGQLVTQTMPGATAQLNEYDRLGQLTNLTYTGQVTPVTESEDPVTGETTWTPGAPQPDRPWLSWTRMYDGLGRVAQEYNGQGAAFDGIPGVSDPADIAAPSVGRAGAADKNFRYDYAGHLTQVTDRTATGTGDTITPDTDPSSAIPCTVRTYTFDVNGNRTSTIAKLDAGGDCSNAAQTSANSYTYNMADQPLAAADGTAYTYDSLGRQTLLPPADAPNSQSGVITMGYYDSDLLRTISQGTTTTTYGIDAVGRRTSTTMISGGVTTSRTRHYVDGSDNPGWSVDSAGSRSRYTPSLGATNVIIEDDGTAQLGMANPHGDVVTAIVVPGETGEEVAAASIESWHTYDEYGNSLAGPTPEYGYLGTFHRESSQESMGLTMMGLRVYNPARGAFASPDPVNGGNETRYNYPNDPVNQIDPTGALSYWDGGGQYRKYRWAQCYSWNVACILAHKSYVSALGATFRTEARAAGARCFTFEGLRVCDKVPSWVFAIRLGGTTYGDTFFTKNSNWMRENYTYRHETARHERRHVVQWKVYGNPFAFLYLKEGSNPCHNYFEIKAGLDDGHYTWC